MKPLLVVICLSALTTENLRAQDSFKTVRAEDVALAAAEGRGESVVNRQFILEGTVVGVSLGSGLSNGKTATVSIAGQGTKTIEVPVQADDLLRGKKGRKLEVRDGGTRLVVMRSMSTGGGRLGGKWVEDSQVAVVGSRVKLITTCNVANQKDVRMGNGRPPTDDELLHSRIDEAFAKDKSAGGGNAANNIASATALAEEIKALEIEISALSSEISALSASGGGGRFQAAQRTKAAKLKVLASKKLQLATMLKQ